MTPQPDPDPMWAGMQVRLAFDGSRDGHAVVLACPVDGGGGWRILGHINDAGLHLMPGPSTDELTQWQQQQQALFVGVADYSPGDEPARYADTGRSSDVQARIEDRIEATVEAVTGPAADLCACGCREPVTPRSPTPFFATKDCNDKWYARLARDLQTEEVRPDDAGDTQPAGEPLWQRQPPPDDPYQSAYRRHCGRCQQLVIPVVYQDNQDIRRFDDPPPVRIFVAQLRHECPDCGEDLPEPQFVGTVSEDPPGRLNLELCDPQGSRARRLVPVAILSRGADPVGFLAGMWAELERSLLRFRRAFHGRQVRP